MVRRNTCRELRVKPSVTDPTPAVAFNLHNGGIRLLTVDATLSIHGNFMQSPFATRRTALPSGGYVENSREGRDSELSRRITALLLFPYLDGRPGPWLLLLTAVCTFVAVYALQMLQA